MKSEFYEKKVREFFKKANITVLDSEEESIPNFV